MMSVVDLHLVSWNRPRMTELVVRTIRRNTRADHYHLVVLDNGSNPETQSVLQRLQDNGYIDELVFMQNNLGLELARQYLLEHNTNGEYFVCIDNDCLPPPVKDDNDWLDRLKDLMTTYEDFGAISMRTQVMIGTGNIFEEADQVGDQIVEFPHPGGSFRIMRTEAVSAVGGWDRSMPGRGAEERYIGGKLNEAKYRTAFAVNVRCLHLFGTRGGQGTDRWGYDKSFKPEDTGHSDITHPALEVGDIKDELLLYAKPDDVSRYFGA